MTQVVIAGMATGTGVEETARQAYEVGFYVALAVDAVADTRADAHAYCIEKVSEARRDGDQRRDHRTHRKEGRLTCRYSITSAFFPGARSL